MRRETMGDICPALPKHDLSNPGGFDGFPLNTKTLSFMGSSTCVMAAIKALEETMERTSLP